MPFLLAASAPAAELQVLHGHVPAAIKSLSPARELPATNRLDLAVCLPLRQTEMLTNMLRDISNPHSPHFRQYLTPGQFAALFGPTEQDIRAITDFARSNGLTVTAVHPNRMVLDLSGPVDRIEKALHLHLNAYQHPTEQRTFFAPDAEPSLDLAVPILQISGLDNYSLPRPRYHARSLASASPNLGAGPGGTYMGFDFREAYVPDTTLTGNGQAVGLLEFDGYTTSDITYYESKAGLPSISLTNVLLDGYTGVPTGDGGEVEVSLDIEVAISMAPGLSKMIVYEAGPNGSWHDILNRMATDNLARQVSCSWYIPGGGPDAVADQIFQEMALQGQSFFNASGDYDAYTGPISFPGDTPYVTQVGGTTLSTTGPGGSYTSEKVWNWGNGVGSAGGISTSYAIPNYQTNISMAGNQGSTIRRNTPDVAMTADNVYVRADGRDLNVGGTSCAAPLWAGFAALVNQQAAATGEPPIGFVNPAIDDIGEGQVYTNCFHDITMGNNTSSSSPNKFYAVAGYDLCTGWGTPVGQKLINALANPEPLIINPPTGFASSGGVGGPFTITSEAMSVTNAGTNSLTWIVTNIPTWLTVSPVSGVLSPSGPATAVNVRLNAAASNLVVSNYVATIWFTNVTDNVGQSRTFSLNIINPPAFATQPTNQAVPDGATATFSVSVTGGTPLTYQWRMNGANLRDGGNISGSASNTLVILNATSTNVGAYAIVVTNAAGSAPSSNASLSIVPSAPVIVQQPTNFSQIVGFPASFSVAAVGSKPFRYQWSLNTTNLPGATNATLTLTNIQFSEAGNYAVVVSNSLGSTLSTNAVLTVLPAPPCATPPTGILGWWKGEGNAFDMIGGDNGVLTNSVSYTNGEVQQAFLFSSDQAAVLLGSPTNLYLQNFTIEAWIKRTSSTISSLNYPDADLFAFGQAGYGFVLNYDGSMSLTQVGVGNVTVGVGLTDTNWHHAAVTKNGSTVIFYCDGVSYPAPSYNPTFVFNTRLTLGARGDTLQNSFYGAIDEMSVYNRALNTNEIQAIYNAGISGKCFEPTPPVITTQPASQSVVVGTSLSLLVVAGGTQPLSYQWSFDGTNISGATESDLVLTNVQLSQSGSYSVVVSNALGSAVSSNAIITVLTAPPCAPQPSGILAWWKGDGTTVDIIGGDNGTLVGSSGYTDGEVGEAFIFSADQAAMELGSPTNLYLQNFTIEAWIQRSSSSFTSLDYPDAFLFSFGQAGYGFVVNSDGTLTLTQVGVGNVTMSTGVVTDTNWHHVAVTKNGGTVLFYCDGIAYSVPAYNPTFTFGTPLTMAARGDNLGNSFYGAIDELAVYNRALSASEIQTIFNAGTSGKCISPIPPYIAQQPTNETVIAGTNATFSVVAGGSYPLFYQWSFNGTNLSGATASALLLANVEPANAGPYSVVVTNAYGSVISSNATLTVVPMPPVIITQPTNQTVVNGNMASFSVAAGGSTPLFYQWNFKGGNISGATNSSLTINDAQASNAGLYSVLVTNAFGSVLSSNAQLTVITGPPCAEPPDGILAWWKGDGTTVDVIGGDNGTLVGSSGYTAGEVSGAFIFSADQAAMELGSPTNLYLQNFTIESWIKRSSSSVTSLDYADADLFAFGQAGYGFVVNFDGTLALTQVGVGNVTMSTGVVTDTNWHHVAVTKNGATVMFYCDGVAYSVPAYNPTFTFGTPLTMGARGDNLQNSFYGAIDELAVYNRALSASEIQTIFKASSSGKCLKPTPPIVTSQPSSQTVSLLGTAQFSVIAAGSQPLTYQWYYNFKNSLPGATNSTLILTNVQYSQAGNYEVVVSNAYGFARSELATLNVTFPDCTSAPSGIISWWKGDGNTLDAQSTNNGVFTGSADYTTGKVGEAFLFSADKAAMKLGSPTNLYLQNFTIEAWIKRSSSSFTSLDYPDADLFAFGQAGYGFVVNSTGTLTLTQVGVGNVTMSTGVVTDTGWHHVAVTKNGSTVLFYCDGVAYSVPSYNPTFTFGTPLTMGARGDNLQNSFFGAIDELAVYNRPLSQAEIQSIYNAGSYGKCPPAPIIATQPVSQLAMLGCEVVLDSAAIGSAPLVYQWWKDGIALGGQTNVMLTITNLQTNNFGNYWVVVTNSFGSAVSYDASVELDAAPVAGPDTLQRFTEGGVKVKVSDLLTNDTDANGDILAIIGVSSNSAASGTISLQGGWIYYTPPSPGFTNTDTFDYVVSDGHCGGTNVGIVTVQIKPDSFPSGTFSIGTGSNGLPVLNFDGIPNKSYRLQWTTTLTNPNWQTLSTNTTDEFGSFQFIDSKSTNSPERFYRAVTP